MVDAVGDIQVAQTVDAKAMWSFQPGVDGVAAVAIASLVSSGNGGHDAGDSVDLADGVVLGIYNYYVVLIVAPDGFRCAPQGGPVSDTLLTLPTILRRCICLVHVSLDKP